MTKKKAVKKIVKKTTKKAKRFYGIVKPRTGAKVKWVSRENKNGWSLGLVVVGRVVWLRNVRFSSMDEVKRAITGNAKIIFTQKVGATK